MIIRLSQKVSLSVFLVFLFLAGSVSAEEKYDEETYGPEAPIVWDQPAVAQFDHKVHTMDAGLSCDDCHDDLYEMESGSASHVTMKEMAEGKSCGKCHDGDAAFSTESDCMLCHRILRSRSSGWNQQKLRTAMIRMLRIWDLNVWIATATFLP